MGKSGNPALKAAQQGDQRGASSAADFKKKRSGVFELPSGLFMKLRNPGGLGLFMKQGIIPNSLMGIANDALDGKKTPAEELLNSSGGVDSQMVDDMMELLDHIIVQCAVDPKVLPAPETEEERDEELLYADEVEDDDKMFVFQWVTGGTADLATFRERQSKNMASLAGRDEVALPTK